MEECLVLSTDVTNGLEWLHDTNFIVDVDHATDESVRSHGLFELLEVNKSCGLANWKVSYLKALIL